jgi:hypothetical protein
VQFDGGLDDALARLRLALGALLEGVGPYHARSTTNALAPGDGLGALNFNTQICTIKYQEVQRSLVRRDSARKRPIDDLPFP